MWKFRSQKRIGSASTAWKTFNAIQYKIAKCVELRYILSDYITQQSEIALNNTISDCKAVVVIHEMNANLLTNHATLF